MSSEHQLPSYSHFLLTNSTFWCGVTLFIVAASTFMALWIFDCMTKNAVKKSPRIHYDCKGFSSNELHLLNVSNVKNSSISSCSIARKGPCQLMQAQGLQLRSCNLPASEPVSRPPNMSKTPEPFNIVEVFEYIDLTNLPIHVISEYPASSIVALSNVANMTEKVNPDTKKTLQSKVINELPKASTTKETSEKSKTSTAKTAELIEKGTNRKENKSIVKSEEKTQEKGSSTGKSSVTLKSAKSELRSEDVFR
ncbi:hypothetical protein QR680_014149 [Steinernema hermaphroditum]|uniref:Uncharacterized protein n=1 Tax=Steinernema hermaphroditum TaxID=289476 RepID=A0AA39I988_9BILA|nr:hypothetical protein QR680_014149 [Steinernema hermaphroditum]